jgi:hypothetical protein
MKVSVPYCNLVGVLLSLWPLHSDSFDSVALPASKTGVSRAKDGWTPGAHQRRYFETRAAISRAHNFDNQSPETLEGQQQLLLETLEAPPVMDLPVYSLSTVGKDGRTNMNILTYASAVGIRPHRKWALSLYRRTKTHENFLPPSRCVEDGASEILECGGGIGVLQLLRRQHAPLVPLLGGESGQDVDKARECEELGFTWRRPSIKDSKAIGEGQTLLSVSAQEREVMSNDYRNSRRTYSLPSNIELLPDCVAYYHVGIDGPVIDAGDHDVVICRINSIFADKIGESGKCGEDQLPMYTGFLRERGIITAAGRVAPAVTTPLPS